ncbi:MAG: undecaprenyl-diphosphate phosphatase [Anaerolineae bacterium]|nr:undecaprenyl-diphosphate phosphatase [Anaerolineae bacterium]
MSEWIKVIILGIVEGITEFLPISSTGHLIVAAAILNFQNSVGGTFEIFIQLGAVIAVLVYYRQALIQQARSLPSSRQTQTFWLAIAIAFVPAAVIGLLLHDWIKIILFSPAVVAVSLIVGGIIFILIERRPRPAQEPESDEAVMQISLRQGLLIGLVQTLALIPGVSRSGASIIGGMQVGLSRRAATQFSFYLAIPTLGIATLYDLVKSLDQISSSQIAFLLVGMIVSGIVAWLSIGWLLRYISRNSFAAFGYYRILAGLLILIAVAAQWL